MCVRLVLALLLVASCGSCISGRDRVIIVRPIRPHEVAFEWERFQSVRGFDFILIQIDIDECRECTYEVPGPTLSVAALAKYINDTCLFKTGCSVTATGTSLMLDPSCRCLTVLVRKTGMAAKTGLTATLWEGNSQDFATSPFTDSFTTVGP